MKGEALWLTRPFDVGLALRFLTLCDEHGLELVHPHHQQPAYLSAEPDHEGDEIFIGARDLAALVSAAGSGSGPAITFQLWVDGARHADTIVSVQNHPRTRSARLAFSLDGLNPDEVDLLQERLAAIRHTRLLDTLLWAVDLTGEVAISGLALFDL